MSITVGSTYTQFQQEDLHLFLAFLSQSNSFRIGKYNLTYIHVLRHKIGYGNTHILFA